MRRMCDWQVRKSCLAAPETRRDGVSVRVFASTEERGNETNRCDRGCEGFDLAFFGCTVFEPGQEVFGVQLVELHHCREVKGEQMTSPPAAGSLSEGTHSLV